MRIRAAAATLALLAVTVGASGCGSDLDATRATPLPPCPIHGDESLVVDSDMGRAIEGSDFSGYYIIGLLEARRVRTPGVPGPLHLSFGLRYRVMNRTPHPMVLRSVNRLLDISDGNDMWIERARASSAVARAEGDASPDRLLRPHRALTTWVVYDVPPGAKDPCMALFAAEFPAARRVLQLPRTKLHPPRDRDAPSVSLGEAPDA